MRNIDRIFSKERLIEITIKVNIFYKEYRKRIEISVIGGQKQSITLEMTQPACHNSEIDCKTGEVKIMRCPEEYGKQQCYKTSVWTDFGQGQGQPDIDKQYYYQSTMLQQLLAGMALVVCLLQQSSQLAIQQWGLQENLTRSPHCINPLYILQALGPCYNNNYLPLGPCIVLMFYYSSTCVFLKANMLPICALISYS